MTYVHDLNPFVIQFTENIGIRWYGLSYLTGFLLGYWLITYLIKSGKSALPLEKAGDFVFTVAMGTVIGGRLGYCLFYDPALLMRFSSTFPFWGVLEFHKGGMASHGGIIGLIGACMIFAKRNNLSILHCMDLTVMGGAIGIFFGRIANFINGELVGRPAESPIPFGVKFPTDILAWPTEDRARLPLLERSVELVGVTKETWQQWIETGRSSPIKEVIHRIIEEVQKGNHAVKEALSPVLLTRHPSQLYEALLEGLFLFLVMFSLWRKNLRPGIISGWFLVLYPIVRIIGEQFRLPDAGIGFQWLGLTRGQWLSVAMLALGTIGLLSWSKGPVVKN